MQRSMRHFYHRYCLPVYVTIGLSGAQVIPPVEFENWNVLQDNQIWVGWADYSGYPWGKSSTILQFSLEEISRILEDKKNYSNVFERVTTSQVIDNNIVYIVLDMPFPFSSRDYIVRYSQLEENGEKIYRFHAVKSDSVPFSNENVRLIHAAGEWRLSTLQNNATKVTYTWNGELLGDFPDWALTRAWTTQGVEVFEWLEAALKN